MYTAGRGKLRFTPSTVNNTNTNCIPPSIHFAECRIVAPADLIGLTIPRGGVWIT